MQENKSKKIKLNSYILFAAFAIIMFIAMNIAMKQQSTKQDDLNKATSNNGENLVPENGDKPLQAVLLEVDTLANTMDLLATESGQEFTVNFSGGTEIFDKYDQVILATQIMTGEIVDAYIYDDGTKLSKLKISDKAWEYKNINKWSIDTFTKYLNIADTKYKYNNNLVVISEGKAIDVFDLNEKDQIIVKGYDKNIYSIIVAKGHGTIELQDYDDFIGGTAYIGSQEILPIEANMVVTVREGDLDIVLEKDNFIGYKSVSVKRGQEVKVNMGEFKKPPVKNGTVKFEIYPEGANLYINNKLQDYKVSLPYGVHTLKVIQDGYSTYSGNINVQEESKTVVINLAEASSNESTSSTEESNTDSNMEQSVNGSSNSNQNAVNDNSSTDETNSSNTETVANSSNQNADDSTEESKNYINIQKPEGVSVYFDAEYKGTTPVKFEKITGTHFVILIKSGYKTQTQTVEIKDDKEDVYLNFSDMDKE